MIRSNIRVAADRLSRGFLRWSAVRRLVAMLSLLVIGVSSVEVLFADGELGGRGAITWTASIGA